MVDAVRVDLEGGRRSREKKDFAAHQPYGETNWGLKRRSNEDAILLGFDLPRPTYAVADGVGGEEHGEIASRTAVVLLRKIAEGSKVVTPEDIAIINSKIDKGFTTLVVAQEIVPNHFRIFSVGDSSALLLDSRKGEIRELTPRDEDRKGRLTQALGNLEGDTKLWGPHVIDVTLTPGQKLILATDGFTRYLDNGKIGIGNVL